MNDRVKEVIDFLNQETGRHYKALSSNARHVNARLNEGFSIDDLKLIVIFKSKVWKDNPNMFEYLRPRTLFGNKAGDYLEAAQASLRGNYEANKRKASPWEQTQGLFNKNGENRNVTVDESGDIISRFDPKTDDPL